MCRQFPIDLGKSVVHILDDPPEIRHCHFCYTMCLMQLSIEKRDVLIEGLSIGFQGRRAYLGCCNGPREGCRHCSLGAGKGSEGGIHFLLDASLEFLWGKQEQGRKRQRLCGGRVRCALTGGRGVDWYGRCGNRDRLGGVLWSRLWGVETGFGD